MAILYSERTLKRIFAVGSRIVYMMFGFRMIVKKIGILKNMCTGYMYIKASDRLATLYDCVSKAGQDKYLTCAFDNNDQTYFNKYVKPGCMFNALQLEKYPNGKMYYDNTDALKESAVLVHFNWVHGHMKMAKMKEHKMWLLTPEEEEI
jgi:hypothetical protein